MKNIKWKNYGLWVSLGALVTLAVTDLTNVAAEDVQNYVNLALAVLAAAGVVSNPEDGKGFKDASKRK